MIRNKWMKLGAAGFLSLSMLTGCGEEDVEVEPGVDVNDPAPENESEEEVDQDAETNSEDNEDEGEDEIDVNE